MRTAYSLVAIYEKSILLVRKSNTWILPGGKPNDGESPGECITRECSEELPGVKVRITRHYGEFTGETPHRGDQLRATAYLGSVDGELRPGAEIAEARFVDAKECKSMNLSHITRKIVARLKRDTFI